MLKVYYRDWRDGLASKNAYCFSENPSVAPSLTPCVTAPCPVTLSSGLVATALLL